MAASYSFRSGYVDLELIGWTVVPPGAIRHLADLSLLQYFNPDRVKSITRREWTSLYACNLLKHREYQTLSHHSNVELLSGIANVPRLSRFKTLVALVCAALQYLVVGVFVAFLRVLIAPHTLPNTRSGAFGSSCARAPWKPVGQIRPLMVAPTPPRLDRHSRRLD